jgi:uncharacterized membrane protein (UPF0127 family)
MNLPQWISLGTGNTPARKGNQAAGSRMLVRNLTRETVLATSLEIAGTAAQRNRGLLGRKGLAYGEGLWIVPCESVHTIGMQFPIDLVYLDRKHRVRKVRSSVPSWRLSACLTAHSVIELPSGTIQTSRTQAGDILEFEDTSEPVELDDPARTGSIL